MASKYEVGYGKPPSQTRFKRGRSGNPKGRPKGTQNLKTDLLEELQQCMVVREGGKARRLTKQRALVVRLFSDAFAGKIGAANLLTMMIMRLLGDDSDPGTLPLNEEEQAVLAHFEERLQQR